MRMMIYQREPDFHHWPGRSWPEHSRSATATSGLNNARSSETEGIVWRISSRAIGPSRTGVRTRPSPTLSPATANALAKADGPPIGKR